MMNLVGCNKEDFYNLMLSMNYKKSKEIDTFMLAKIKRKISFLI